MEKAAVILREAPALHEGWRWNGRTRRPEEHFAIFDNGDLLARAEVGPRELSSLGYEVILVPVGKNGAYDVYVPVKK